MNKVLNKFMIMLILTIMAFEIVLPLSVYATNDGMEMFIPTETAWYRYSHMTGKDLNTEIAKEKEFYLQMYYEESGEKHTPTVVVKAGKAQVYLTKGNTYYYPKQSGLFATPNSFNKVVKNDSTLGNTLKYMVARFFYALGTGLHWLVGFALGETVTIDDLVFNNYAETNISFFDSKEEAGDNASTLIYGTNGVGGLDTVINRWYGIFLKIAIMAYMIVLVYMGLRIMLNSTADKKANYKKLFVDWVVGLAILFLLPYAMKYMIKINGAFVETIEANKGYESPVSAPLENLDYDKKFSNISIDEEIDWENGTDYMSKIAYAAKETSEPAIALAFLIMTWQLVALVFHYYKRLFMIAFLIIIFPLVGIWYAIDKIADGKSQAFNTWLKEFMLNVFVQTFHAIVYVFVCSTIYSASGIVPGGAGFDFILIIVGVTFLFKGEEIIRKIFGQDSTTTMNNLSGSAAATFAKFKIVEKTIKSIGAHTVGEKSIPRKVTRGVNRIRAYSARERAFDATATPSPEYNIGARLEHSPEALGEGATEQEKSNYLKEMAYYNAAATLNNPKSHSLAEKAKALNMLKDKAIQDPNNDVFKDTKMTSGQITALAMLDDNVHNMISAGRSRVDIDREITVRMGIVFAGESEDTRNDIKNTYYTSLFIDGGRHSVSKAKIRKEIESIKEEAKDIRNSLAFATNKDKIDDVETDVASDAYEMYTEYEKAELSEEEKNSIKGIALNIARLNRRNSGAYNEKELLDIANYVRAHEEDNEIVNQMIEQELGVDIDLFMHTLAKKVMDESTMEEAKRIASTEVESYEKDARNGYFDDEVSLHEVIKEMDNQDKLDEMIEKLYKTKKEAMKNATESVAEAYLEENKIDILEGHYDKNLRTQGGLTKEEIQAKKWNEFGKMFSDLGAMNKASASNESSGAFGWLIKERLAREEEKRTGISRKVEDKRNINDSGITVDEYIEKKKNARDVIQNRHFTGDIWDK